VLAVLLLSIVGLFDASAWAARVPVQSVASSNSVVFTHDRWHPERTVVGSSTVLTRTAGQALMLTISAVPSGRFMTFSGTLRNVSGTRVAFGRSGLRVDGVVTRNGAPSPSITLHAARLRSLAAGGTVSLSGRFALPRPGTYVVEAVARY
jgi:hypothetical protein